MTATQKRPSDAELVKLLLVGAFALERHANDATAHHQAADALAASAEPFEAKVERAAQAIADCGEDHVPWDDWSDESAADFRQQATAALRAAGVER